MRVRREVSEDEERQLSEVFDFRQSQRRKERVRVRGGIQWKRQDLRKIEAVVEERDPKKDENKDIKKDENKDANEEINKVGRKSQN